MNSANFLNTSHQMLSWFDEQNQLGHLELRPSFQRRPVWNDNEKAFLIDSILRGYPVPEIYVQSSTQGASTNYAVVDGQQRLRACLEFLNNGYAVTFDTAKLAPLHSLSDTPWFGKSFDQLAPAEQQRFRRYKMIVRDLEEAGDQEVRHLFFRLNQSNISLNAQELRYSIYQGGLLELVEELVERPEWDHYRVFTTAQRRRMLDSEYVSELVVGYLHWPQNKKDALDGYFRLYAADLPSRDEVLQVFTRTLALLVEMFPQPHMAGTRWYRKSDFYTLFLAIARGGIQVDGGAVSDIAARISTFGALVSQPHVAGEPEAVTSYRNAVERAATDRGRRVRREQALIAYVYGESLAPDDLGDDDQSSDSAEQESDDEGTDEEYVDTVS